MVKETRHKAVLTEEVVRYLEVKSGEKYLDCTFGGGGHSRAILEKSAPTGEVTALDRDSLVQEFTENMEKSFPKSFHFHPISYSRLDEIEERFDGIIFDLGLSSDQLDPLPDEPGRGFSFAKEESLDMRFDATHGQTAAQFLMQASQARLEQVFYTYAEDRYGRQLARKVIEYRRLQPIRTTTDFVRLVGTNQPKVLAPLFQALRIEVNDELQTLKTGLQLAKNALNKDGRLVVISFHSLEDRIVKEFMKESMQVLTKKPVLPSAEEIVGNSRSRSAKLRAGKLKNE